MKERERRAAWPARVCVCLLAECCSPFDMKGGTEMREGTRVQVRRSYKADQSRRCGAAAAAFDTHTRVIVSFPAASLPLLETSDAIPILLTDSPPCLLHLSSTSCAANLAPNECNNKLPLRLVYPCLTKDLTTFGLLSHAVSPFYPVH